MADNTPKQENKEEKVRSTSNFENEFKVVDKMFYILNNLIAKLEKEENQYNSSVILSLSEFSEAKEAHELAKSKYEEAKNDYNKKLLELKHFAELKKTAETTLVKAKAEELAKQKAYMEVLSFARASDKKIKDQITLIRNIEAELRELQKTVAHNV